VPPPEYSQHDKHTHETVRHFDKIEGDSSDWTRKPAIGCMSFSGSEVPFPDNGNFSDAGLLNGKNRPQLALPSRPERYPGGSLTHQKNAAFARARPNRLLREMEKGETHQSGHLPFRRASLSNGFLP
jgi:hypothetical protein